MHKFSEIITYKSHFLIFYFASGLDYSTSNLQLMSRFSMQTVSIFSKPRRGRTTTFCRGKWPAQQHDFTLIDSFLEGFLHVGGTAEMLKLIMKCERM